MKSIFLFCLFYVGLYVHAQNFPQTWEGIWQGELNIYSSASAKSVQTLTMQLKIQPIDAKTWAWEIGYLVGEGDIRKYELHEINAEKNEWLIDEKNGILLNQRLLGNRLIGSFSIEKSLIINSYEFNNDSIIVEFYSTQLDPENTIGLGTEESPVVGNHKVGNYQKAVLKKVNK